MEASDLVVEFWLGIDSFLNVYVKVFDTLDPLDHFACIGTKGDKDVYNICLGGKNNTWNHRIRSNRCDKGK